MCKMIHQIIYKAIAQQTLAQLTGRALRLFNLFAVNSFVMFTKLFALPRPAGEACRSAINRV